MGPQGLTAMQYGKHSPDAQHLFYWEKKSMKDPKQQFLDVIAKLMLKQKLNTDRPEIFPSPVKSSEKKKKMLSYENFYFDKATFTDIENPVQM